MAEVERLVSHAHAPGSFPASRHRIDGSVEGVAAMIDAARPDVELTATDPDPSPSLQICRPLGAEVHGVIHQRDTYFNTRHGGLKLREGARSAHLIQFERADRPEQRLGVATCSGPGVDVYTQRLSSYRVVEVPDAAELRVPYRTGDRAQSWRSRGDATPACSSVSRCTLNSNRSVGRSPPPCRAADRRSRLGCSVEFEAIAPPERALGASTTILRLSLNLRSPLNGGKSMLLLYPEVDLGVA